MRQLLGLDTNSARVRRLEVEPNVSIDPAALMLEAWHAALVLHVEGLQD